MIWIPILDPDSRCRPTKTISPVGKALGSRKCRSKCQAWLHKNVRHQTDWSKVSLYTSHCFLSKNQLARDGPESGAPVVITVLVPTLNSSLCGGLISLSSQGTQTLPGQDTEPEKNNQELLFVLSRNALTRIFLLRLSLLGSKKL